MVTVQVRQDEFIELDNSEAQLIPALQLITDQHLMQVAVNQQLSQNISKLSESHGKEETLD
jgi:hypothetical protein